MEVKILILLLSVKKFSNDLIFAWAYHQADSSGKGTKKLTFPLSIGQIYAVSIARGMDANSMSNTETALIWRTTFHSYNTVTITSMYIQNVANARVLIVGC